MTSFLRALVAVLSLLPLACTGADSSDFQLGKQYLEVQSPQLPADPSKIEVMEVFWYGCPHCYKFDGYLDKWLEHKPADVNFVRLPASIGHGLLFSRAFYTAQLLGVSDRIHKPLFDGIHKDNKTELGTVEGVRALFVAQGVKAEDFDSTFNSFAVDTRVRAAETRLRDMGIASVPTMIVQGRYYSDGPLAGNYDTLLKVVDFLVDKARKERAPK